MAQIDFITYSGQLVTTLVAFTTLHFFITTVVRTNTHTFVGFWNVVPAITGVSINNYYARVNNLAALFSNTFKTLVLRMVDVLTVFTSNTSKTSTYLYNGTWKKSVLNYVSNVSKLVLGA